MKRLAILWMSGLVLYSAPLPLASQQRAAVDDFRLSVRGASEVLADPGSVVTVVLSIENRTAAPLTLTPVLTLPDRWLVATGSAPLLVASRASDVFIVGVSIPRGAQAERYVLRVGARAGGPVAGHTVSDSVTVQVKKRQELTLLSTDHPPYVINGDSYKTGFLLQNRGNAPVRVRLAASSGLDRTPKIDKPTISLAPNEAATVNVTVAASGSGSATADVVELKAFDETTPTDTVSASSLVTVVERPGASDPLITFPATLKVRGAAPGTEIAPYELSGAGRLRDGRDEEINFLFRGKAAASSPFGEREEYRFELRSPHLGLKLGDNYFTRSQLTGSGQTGFGAGLELGAGPLAAGGYIQRFRFLPGQSERAAFIRLQSSGPMSALTLTVNGVERVGGILAGRVISPALTIRAPFATVLEVEGAASTADAGNGKAESARLSGGDRLRFDLSHVRGDSLFAGPVRNARNDYGNLSLLLVGKLRVTGTGSLSKYEPIGIADRFNQGFEILATGFRYADRLSLEYSTVSKVDSLLPDQMGPRQRLIRGRIDQPSRFGNSWISAETGERLDSTAGQGAYHQVLFGTSFAAAGSWISLFAEYYDGGSLLRGPVGMKTVGASTSLRLTPWTTLSVFGYGSRTKTFREQTATEVDAKLSQLLYRGAALSVRARYSALLPGYRRENLIYSELSIPFGVPTGRLRSPGRISGKVIDTETGLGLSGALVRLGPRAAVTDKNGVVTFAGLPPGEYRVSLASEASLSNTAIRGNPVINVDTSGHGNQTFDLEVGRASSVRGTVRQFAIAQTSLTGAPDSLVDNGPLQGMLIALISGPDTLYHVSDIKGEFAFTEISAAVWTVQIQGDVPPSMHFDHSQFVLATAPGEDVRIEFRVLPNKKPVIIDEDVPPPPVLTPSPAPKNRQP